MHAFNVELTKLFLGVNGNKNKDAFWAAKDTFYTGIGLTFPDILETTPVVPNDGTLKCSIQQWDTLRKHLITCGFSLAKNHVESIVVRTHSENKNVIEVFHVEYDQVNQTEFFPLNLWREALAAAVYRYNSNSSSKASPYGLPFETAALVLEIED